jgi:hypothetical protein
VRGMTLKTNDESRARFAYSFLTFEREDVIDPEFADVGVGGGCSPLCLMSDKIQSVAIERSKSVNPGRWCSYLRDVLGTFQCSFGCFPLTASTRINRTRGFFEGGSVQKK